MHLQSVSQDCSKAGSNIWLEMMTGNVEVGAERMRYFIALFPCFCTGIVPAVRSVCNIRGQRYIVSVCPIDRMLRKTASDCVKSEPVKKEESATRFRFPGKNIRLFREIRYFVRLAYFKTQQGAVDEIHVFLGQADIRGFCVFDCL